MHFEWGERKSEENNRTRGLTFGYAALVFGGPVVVREDLRFPYGERRIIALGTVDGHCLTVVFTDRMIDDVLVRRIISARKSNRKERRYYEQAYPTTAWPRRG